MYDLLLRGGCVIDGTGKARCRADVAVKDGLIADIGILHGAAAKETLDAEGLAVAPGFIDAHSHSDTSFLIDPSGASKLYQGVTTEITGNCGSSPFPCREGSAGGDIRKSASFRRFLDTFEVEGHHMAVNQAPLVGHGTLRRCVIGDEDRAPTEMELKKMRRLLDKELSFGAWGLSLGLEYAPGCFAAQEELNALGKSVKKFDGVVTCHMRSEGLEIEKALEELITVGRISGAKVNVSHLKIDNYTRHGIAPKIWQIIEDARRGGVAITADMYPYAASCTTLSIRCPKWSLDGGSESLLRRLRGERRADVVDGIRTHYFSAERAETCLFCDDGGYWPEIVGKTLRHVAENLIGTSDYAQAAAEVLIKTQAQARCIFFVMSPEDVSYFLKCDTGIGSDGYALPLNERKLPDRPHPRSYGAIAEFLRIAREEALCPLEEAVRRITGKPAGIFGIRDRGRLQTGFAADICVFDPETVAPRSTYLDPVRPAQGIKHVVINGAVAMRDGEQTELRNGRFLRKGLFHNPSNEMH